MALPLQKLYPQGFAGAPQVLGLGFATGFGLGLGLGLGDGACEGDGCGDGCGETCGDATGDGEDPTTATGVVALCVGRGGCGWPVR
jgi:hypothetical protein